MKSRHEWGMWVVGVRVALGCGAACAALLLGGCETAPSSATRADGPGPRIEPTGPGGGDLARTIIPGIAGEPDIRVRLASASTGVRLGATSGSTVYISQSGVSRQATRMNAPVEARLTSTGWELTDTAGLMGKFERGTDLTVTASEPTAAEKPEGRVPTMAARGSSAGGTKLATPPAMVTVNGGKYMGVIRMTPRTEVSARAFDVIETVGIEDYLKGVVSAELPANWPLTAFKVQAIAARSYAIHERQRARQAGSTFDVESSVKDQAYKGASELPTAVSAVNDTRGIVLTSMGSVLRAYYSSTSGGRAASAKDTWPTGPGYEYNLAGPLQATTREYACDASPFNRWTVVRNRAELARRIRAWGQDAGHAVKNLTSIESARVAATNNVGRPTKYWLMQAGGMTYTLSAEELRRACNQEVAGLTAITRDSRVNSGDMEWASAGDSITIRGRGFGHGVGMCQYSAKGMADRGDPYTKILMNFYPGARIERAY